MNRAEYNDWYRDLARRCPGLHQWIEQVADTAGTLSAWFDDVFSGLELGECLQINLGLCTGDVEKPWGGDLPAFFRREVRKAAYDRNERQTRARLRRERDSGPGPWEYVQSNMGAALDKALEIIREERARGMGHDEACWIMREPRNRGGRREEWAALVEG